MKKFQNTINKVVEALANVLLWFSWAIAGIILWEIILRVFFNRPTIWAHELSIMIFGALSMLGGSYAHKCRGHVNMDLFYARLSPKKKARWDVITFPFFCLFGIILIWKGGAFAWRAIITGELSQSTWAPILWPIKLTIPVGGLLLLLQGIANLISDVQNAFSKKEVT